MSRSAFRLAPILERDRDVSFRWFDPDALGDVYSDLVLCEFEDFERYQYLWEEIRESEFFTVPFANRIDGILGSENGFQRFEASLTE